MIGHFLIAVVTAATVASSIASFHTLVPRRIAVRLWAERNERQS
jgi:hypothetical protein